MIAKNDRLLDELRNAVGIDDGIFKEELFIELQQRLNEMKEFSARIDHVLENKPRMKIIKCKGNKTSKAFDLRTLNQDIKHE